jgi:hypothetical protein
LDGTSGLEPDGYVGFPVGAGKMTSPPGKVRTRGHVLADLSINHVERQVLLCGCSVQRVHNDYGYDLMMSTYNAQGEIEGGIVFFQVKATDHLPVLADRKAIAWSISRRDLHLWLNEAYPVILVVYAGPSDRAYWLHVQAYFADYPTADLFRAGETITVRIPMANRLNRRSLERIIKYKNDLHELFQGRVHEDA